MAVVAPLCKFKKDNYKIGIVVCLVLAGWCAYDGYFNKDWIEKHKEKDGSPKTYLVVNRQAPLYLVGAAVLLCIGFMVVKNKKLIAEEEELVFSENDKIPYGSIESVNKTNFETEGFFVIEYKLPNGQKSQRKVSDRTYDNLNAVLEVIVSKITG